MNSLEKKSFSSFLFLYLGSSFIFVLLSGFWYFSAQKTALQSATYYKLQHLTDKVSALIINAHMMDEKLELPIADTGFEYMMIPSSEQKVYTRKYFKENTFTVLVSSAPQKHLSIEYVVAKTDTLHKGLESLKLKVISTMLVVFLSIGLISWLLSKLFMRPIRDKMIHIEQFIQDISHELNTPITALKMSSKRALQKKVYDENILRNISISTKQLYSIYQSLAYLNFSSQKQELVSMDLKPVLTQSVEYYTELSMAKNIKIEVDLQSAYLDAVESRIELLFSNLISNAIKYSMPNTTITMSLREGYFSIEDEGVGIAKDKLQDIFKLYERSSNLAGGFGVGLSIVKQICDAFKIELRVESELDKGSRFILQWKH
ncbi:MAG: HAMP domain-containing sensor histidine kinase [Sulfurimonas sp.]|nr:HAMP domain-containing sensor histidine kinase [Sulfurimonas sp.]